MTESPETILYLSIIKALTVLLGLVIVYLGARAYRAQPRKPLLWLTIGIGVLTLGAISEGVAFQGLGWSLDQSHLFEAFVTLAGFGVLVYSLYSS